jgi:hypothetical protein
MEPFEIIVKLLLALSNFALAFVKWRARNKKRLKPPVRTNS